MHVQVGRSLDNIQGSCIFCCVCVIQGESFTEGVGPDMLALLRKEDVDFLPYVPWKETWMDTGK